MRKAVANRLHTGRMLKLSVRLPLTLLLGHTPSHELKCSGLANRLTSGPTSVRKV